jgi:thiol-disulfide isomerase/thioredoxin
MIRKAIIQFAAFAFIYSCSLAQGNSFTSKNVINGKTGVITVAVQIKAGIDSKDSIQIDFAPAHAIGLTPYAWYSVKKKTIGGSALLSYYATDISLIKMPFMANLYSNWFAEPGDSIVIIIDRNNLKFSGVGADKFILQHEIKTMRERIKAPTKEPILLNPVTFAEYFKWINLLNEYEHQFYQLINSYRGKVSAEVLDRINDRERDFVIAKLKDLFFKLREFARKDEFKVITTENICDIYDTTVANKIKKWFPFATDGFLGTWTILKTQVGRKYKFQYDEDPLKSELMRTILLYEEGLKLYRNSPLSREQFLVRVLTEEMLDDIGMTPEIKDLLDKYYSEPGYPEYKEYVRNYELKKKLVRNGKKVPDVSFTDDNGNPFAKKDIQGKIVLMDFWFTGCAGCVDMVPVLKRIEDEFKGDTNVVFLSISADKERAKWIKSISEKKYTTGNAINLYTNGNGFDDYTLRALAISSYPYIYLLDQESKIIENPLPDPRKDNGKYIIDLIHRKRSVQNDGPYIIYNGDSVATYSLKSSAVHKKVTAAGKSTPFLVQTDEYEKFFSVTLKNDISTEPAEFSKPEKILAVSDIEGNFDALRKLLQSNGVIDDKYNWTFGKGHLVFNGDIFDRGEQVTECLWLIYSLEEKAKSVGGYVHYILGNHEIMNLSGNHNYVKSKYTSFSQKIGKTYAEMFSTASELGRWLRSKNIMEKIGNLLFVHGGISQEMNQLKLSIARINELARPYYDKDLKDMKMDDPVLSLIYDKRHTVSPFWYRLYYLNKDSSTSLDKRTLEKVTSYKASTGQVEETLKKFGVDHIITGHTLIEPEYKLTVHYQGKVINTDTHHASGVSEALLVEGGSYYRVNDKGVKLLLFSDH